MGDLADAMLDGTLCEGCGTFIESETVGNGGFPVLCAFCWLDLPENERRYHPHEKVTAADRRFHKRLNTPLPNPSDPEPTP